MKGLLVLALQGGMRESLPGSLSPPAFADREPAVPGLSDVAEGLLDRRSGPWGRQGPSCRRAPEGGGSGAGPGPAGAAGLQRAPPREMAAGARGLTHVHALPRAGQLAPALFPVVRNHRLYMSFMLNWICWLLLRYAILFSSNTKAIR